MLHKNLNIVDLTLQLGIVALVLLCETEAWWLVGKNGNDHQCPRRGTNVYT